MSQQQRREKFEKIAEEVFEPLQRYLRRRVDRNDVDDLLSEVLTTIWRRIDDAPASHSLPWCYGVARRALANHRRGNQRRLRLVERLGAEPATHHYDQVDQLGDSDLATALGSLPGADQELLRLWAWEQLEPREIAAALGLTPNATALRLSRARKKLAEAVGRQELARAGHRSGKDPEGHPDD